MVRQEKPIALGPLGERYPLRRSEGAVDAWMPKRKGRERHATHGTRQVMPSAAVPQLAWRASCTDLPGPSDLVAIILAGALLTTGVVLAVGPRLWQVANAHEELPVELPEFQPLSQRTLVYDVVGNVIAVFERENSQPITLSPGAADGDRCAPRRRGQRVLLAPRRQPARLLSARCSPTSPATHPSRAPAPSRSRW